VRYRSRITREPYGYSATKGVMSATLELACMHAALNHSVYNASWAQRYGVGVTIPHTTETGNGQGRHEITPDPSTVMLFSPMEDANSPSLGQWAAPTSPTDIIETIERRERMALSDAGLNPADLMRATSDPRSGFALSVSRSAQRQKQMEVSPLFEVADQELLRVTATQANRLLGQERYPESGLTVTYQGIPQTPEERQADRDHVTQMLELGMIDPVTAYQHLNPGVSEAQAFADLVRIRKIRAQLTSQGATP